MKTNSQIDTMMRVDQVSKRYGAAIVLADVTFDIQSGEAVALWGVNGAGKTTLIKAALGLIEFKGTIEVHGADVARHGKAARSLIGYVPQEAAFYDMSVESTMAFYARLKHVAPARMSELLNLLGLDSHARKSVLALSGGLKQRLALAIALLADPPILLLDEPTANLDAAARHDYLTLLSTLRKQHKTILFASHRVEEVEALADRVLMMEAGRVTECLTPGDVRLRLAPHVELTLWVSDADRPNALAAFQNKGWDAHLNGRGTVVVRLESGQKLQPLSLLAEQGITVTDFEMERGRLWN